MNEVCQVPLYSTFCCFHYWVLDIVNSTAIVHGAFVWQMFVYALLYNSNTVRSVYHAPTFSDLLADVPRSFYHHSDVLIPRTPEKTVYHVVSLPTLTSAYQAYTAHVDILDCSLPEGMRPSFIFYQFCSSLIYIFWFKSIFFHKKHNFFIFTDFWKKLNPELLQARLHTPSNTRPNNSGFTERIGVL